MFTRKTFSYKQPVGNCTSFLFSPPYSLTNTHMKNMQFQQIEFRGYIFPRMEHFLLNLLNALVASL